MLTSGDKKSKIRLQKVGLITSLFLFYLIVFTPILQAGFFSDDIANSLNVTYFSLKYHGLWDAFYSINMSWMVLHGRLYPLGLLTTFVFSFIFYKLLAYQIAHVILITMTILSFAWLLKLIAKQGYASLLFLFLYPLFWSIRTVNDPLVSFAALLPILTLWMILSVIFFVKYQENRSRFLRWMSLVMYACALLTYEMGITTMVTIGLLASIQCKSKKDYILQVFPYVVLTLLYVMTCVVLQKMSASVYPGIQLGTLTAASVTFSKQWFAALPFSFWLLADKPLLFSNSITYSLSTAWINIAFILLVVITAYWIYFFAWRLSLSKKANLAFLAIGVSFMLVPALLIGVSKRYQAELYWGYGYLPVYVQYFGACLLFLSALNLLSFIKSYSLKKIVCLLISLLISIFISFSFLLNFATVQFINDEAQNPRFLVEKAVRHQLLSSMPDSAVLIAKERGWHAESFYRLHGVITRLDALNIKESESLALSLNDSLRSNKPHYFLDYHHLSGTTQGYVIMGKVKSIYQPGKNHTTFTLENPRLFLAIDHDSSPCHLMIILTALKKDKLSSSKNINLNSIEEMIKPRNWIMIDLPHGFYQVKLGPEKI